MKKLTKWQQHIMACAHDKTAYYGKAYFEIGPAKGVSKRTIQNLVDKGYLAFASPADRYHLYECGFVYVVPVTTKV